MAIICGRQMGLDMPTLAKQFKTSKLVIWATLNTPNRSKTTGRPLKTSSGDDRIIVRMSKKNPRLTSTEINSELKDHYGVQVFKDTVKKRLRHALLFRRRPVNKPMIPDKNRSARLNDESKYLMIGTDGVTLVRRPGDKRNDPKYQVPTVKHYGSWVVIPTGQRSETLFPLRQGLVRTASSERFDLTKTISRPESHRASLGDPDELDRVHAKRCEAVIKAKGMATKY
uniref:HTH_Tnp_Tc3_2 domain-containing protein n=1 Tax=Caenorhabditis japonica TaxID=281687 RepID=A0A8R1E5R3_CAEJA